MNAPDFSTLQMSRFIRAPRERVYDAFVTEAALRVWKCPRGMTVEQIELDAAVGGRWRLAMRSGDGSRFVVGGAYRELTRPTRIAYSWHWETAPMAGIETRVEVDFSEQDGGTLLQMRHSGFPAAAARDGHAQGWNASLNKLTELLDARGTAATLTLLGDPRSTYVRSVRMGLAEKGIAHTLQPCAPHSPEVLAVHPFGRIPALRDGDLAVFETSAILRYLNECFGGPSLLPDSINERARCEQWVSATHAYLYDTMVRRYVLQYVLPKGEGGRPDRGVIDAALPQIRAQLALLNRAYDGADFLAGARVSMADLLVAPILAYVEAMPEGAQLLDGAPHVRRAQGLIRQRPSFTTTERFRPPTEGKRS